MVLIIGHKYSTDKYWDVAGDSVDWAHWLTLNLLEKYNNKVQEWKTVEKLSESLTEMHSQLEWLESLLYSNENAKDYFPVKFSLKSTCFMAIMGFGIRT